MRLINDKKGQVRVIEAFFASILLLSCLTLVPAQVNPKGSSDNLSSTAENVLLSLDSNGKLGLMVDSTDWSGLKNYVESALPLTVWFNLTVFDKDMTVLNEFPICNGGAVSEQIVSVQYVCASQNSNYKIYILQLQLAVVD
ncbi:MAG: hypothetical protein NWE95_04330 [Candidatus Bathyarchaeota archaeon]|nr:hypothetical protein [Candidatus Bathyarchaeota archaeon]